MSRTDEKIVAAIEELRSGAAATVTLHPPSGDIFVPFCTIECTADWTGFNSESFAGDSLLEALEAAVAKKHYRMRHPNAIPENRQLHSVSAGAAS